MEQPFIDQAIPMVEVDQTGKYNLTKQAITFLRAIQGPIAVVSVAGLYRTGKSYLLNRVLLNRSNGFGVGPTVNPCTKGLWCWGNPIKGTSTDGEPVNIIVIDTEGIGALDQDTTHDTKIFTLAILASSCFIYNSQGSIDQNAIQNLSLVVNLTKHIQLKASGQDQDGQDPDEISLYFPSFYWVVRDFSLQLQDQKGNQINSKEYLEKALAPQNGFSDDIEEKNRIRRLLTAFFKDRDCYTMIRPLVDQQKLQNLDKMDYDELRPEFVHQAMNFRKRILTSVKVKSLKNQKLNGDMYCSMINSYVNAINQGAVPNIQNAWKYMCQEQCQKSLDDCIHLFEKELEERLGGNLKTEDDFNRCLAETEEKTLDAFRAKALGDNSNLVMSKLKEILRERLSEIKERNMKESQDQIKRYIIKNIEPVRKKLSSNIYRSYPQFEKEVTMLFEKMMKEGPKYYGYKFFIKEAHQKFSSQGAEFLFKNFMKLQQKENERQKENELKYQSSIQQATESIQHLQKQKRQLTNTTDETILHLKNKLDTLSSQLDMTSKTKVEEEKKLERQYTFKIQDYENSKRTMEIKIREMMEKMESEQKRFNLSQKEWEKDKAVLELRTQQQLKELEEFNKKEKKLQVDQNTQLNDMVFKTKELSQKHQREREELKRSLKDLQEKYTDVSQELSSTKQEFEDRSQKWQKKEKKFKEDLSNIRKENESIKCFYEQEKNRLKDQGDNIKTELSKETSQIEARLKEAERTIKEITDSFKIEKNNLEIENQKLIQSHRHLNEMYQKQKQKNQYLVKQQSIMRTDLETQLKQRGEEQINRTIQNIRQQHLKTEQSMKTQHQQKIVIYQNELISLKVEKQNLEQQLTNLGQQRNKMKNQYQSEIQRLRSQTNNQKDLRKKFQFEKETQKNTLQNELRRIISELENQIDEIKEKSEKQNAERQRQSEDYLNQIKNAQEMEKETVEKRYKSEISKLKRRNDEMTEEYQRKIEEERETLQEEIQDMQQKMQNQSEFFRQNTQKTQHQLDTCHKKITELSSALEELRARYEKRDLDIKARQEEINITFRLEKKKLDEKIDKLSRDNHICEKDLMAMTQNNEQQRLSLERKEQLLSDLQKEITNQKQIFGQENDKLYNKIADIERCNHERVTNYQKDNALLKQKNEFSDSRIGELQKTLHTSNKVFEDKLNQYKMDKQYEVKEKVDKLMEERAHIEGKYAKLKQESKEKEENMKKALIDLNTTKQTNTMRISALESRNKELEDKKTLELTQIQSELTKYKSQYSLIRTEYDDIKRKNMSQIEGLQGELKDSELKYQKEKSLLMQQIEFTEKSKADSVSDLQQRLQRAETMVSQMNETKNMQRSKADKYYQESVRNSQNTYTQRISEIQETSRKQINERDYRIKDFEQSIKELRERYETEKMQKESAINSYEKKFTEIGDSEKLLRNQIERLKNQKQKRELEYSRRENQVKDKYKERMNELETKVKVFETEKNGNKYVIETERIKWNMEKEQLKQKLTEIEERQKKAEKDRDRLKVDNERLKAERKNKGGHSYIGFKTTHQVPKVQEKNKQNVSHQ